MHVPTIYFVVELEDQQRWCGWTPSRKPWCWGGVSSNVSYLAQVFRLGRLIIRRKKKVANTGGPLRLEGFLMHWTIIITNGDTYHTTTAEYLSRKAPKHIGPLSETVVNFAGLSGSGSH